MKLTFYILDPDKDYCTLIHYGRSNCVTGSKMLLALLFSYRVFTIDTRKGIKDVKYYFYKLSVLRNM